MKTILTASLLFITTALSAQTSVLISDFTTLPSGFDFTGGLGSWNNGSDQFTVNSGVLTVGPVSGGNPDNMGYFGTANIAGINFDATGLLRLSVTVRLDAGNLAPGFIINLFDGDGSAATALTATFSASDFNSVSFTTGTALLNVHPEGGNIANIQYFGIAGTGTGAAFRISFDSISATAVPEPGTYAALAGVVALGFAVWRRRVSALRV